ncbi:zinc-binding dehydrogenase [Acidipropionibacterium virtanenii]|uniref:Phthiocerol/phenolphthiocerol synthesis polyketide synthase type I PpsC n=1 Tax=Acidipropionibacterium virtanenii TaxID=2057246 RepID=A0A344UVS5_9ACTN|nr:zinc-binding dehydrogenase [Acidipropionibacterium virtanenii]AXE39373.1 Phthiocerol/phenolphthiocerol synthesis polyketide synthase type I PpsC [Acidipropionibacterium virtanenii]
MRALLLPTAGGFDSLEVGQAPRPRPGAGQVLIAVHAVGLNPVEYKVARGGGVPTWHWPHILGQDCAGVIAELGEGVSEFRVGDRVACHGDLGRQGSFAEYVADDAEVIARVPEGVDDISAAALPCAGMTAYQAIVHRLHVEPGQTVLVTAGAGGVGGYAIQLARIAGARVLATASAGNAERLRALGAEPIDYRSTDVVREVRRLTDGRGVDGILDTVGGDSATANLQLLVHGGGIVTIDGRPDLTTVPELTIAPSVHEVALGAAYQWGDAAAHRRLSTDLAALLDLVAAGRLDPMVTRTVTLDEIPAALHDLEGRHVAGKIVARIAD